jgi:hypothetical protein
LDLPRSTAARVLESLYVLRILAKEEVEPIPSGRGAWPTTYYTVRETEKLAALDAFLRDGRRPEGGLPDFVIGERDGEKRSTEPDRQEARQNESRHPHQQSLVDPPSLQPSRSSAFPEPSWLDPASDPDPEEPE